MNYNKKLVLKDGTVFNGFGHGADRETIGELVFNTSMVGYQEIATDPSYNGQIVVMTYPLIGNYGVNDEDYESKNVRMNGFVVREYNDIPSNFRATSTFSELLEDHNIPLIDGIDTRMLTRIIRDKGSQVALITSFDTPMEECMEKLNSYVVPKNQVEEVSSKKKWISRCKNPKFNIVCIDFGTKLNIIRRLNYYGCTVTVVPYNTTAKEIMDLNPDGLFLSNGPGDPENNTVAIEVVKELRGKLPIFGICLGHQIIGIAYGAKTYKMKFGHRGANHPVKNLLNDTIEITSQNHSFAIDKESLSGTGLEITHINVLDGELEGMQDVKNHVMSIQYHPESAAGPEDSEYLFKQYLSLLHDFGGEQ